MFKDVKYDLLLKIKKIVILNVIICFIGFKYSWAESNNNLILTGDFYQVDSLGNYYLEIYNTNDLLNLNGKKLGFKIISKDDSSGIISPILAARCLTSKGHSDLIFALINKMMIADKNQMSYIFKTDSDEVKEAFIQFQNLLDDALSKHQEELILEYYDNRLDGDPLTKVKVTCKFGSSTYNKTGNSEFIFYKAPKLTETNLLVSKSRSINKEDKMNLDILNLLNNNNRIEIKSHKLDNNVLSKNLLVFLLDEKYRDHEIIFEKCEGKKVLYRWQLPINNIHRCQNFDLKVMTTNKDIENRLTKRLNGHYKLLSFSQREDLPISGKFEISFNLDGYDMSKLKIFSVNLSNNKLEKNNINFKIKNGMFIMPIGFGTDYIITDQLS